MKKLSFDEALERLDDGRYVSAKEVSAKALNRVLWVSEWHIPGCLPESMIYSTTKGAALDASLLMAEWENGFPRGMKTALMREGRFDSNSHLYGRVINTIYKTTLGAYFKDPLIHSGTIDRALFALPQSRFSHSPTIEA